MNKDFKVKLVDGEASTTDKAFGISPERVEILGKAFDKACLAQTPDYFGPKVIADVSVLCETSEELAYICWACCNKYHFEIQKAMEEVHTQIRQKMRERIKSHESKIIPMGPKGEA